MPKKLTITSTNYLSNVIPKIIITKDMFKKKKKKDLHLIYADN